MGNKASNHKAETNSVRLGWWTGAEIADRRTWNAMSPRVLVHMQVTVDSAMWEERLQLVTQMPKRDRPFWLVDLGKPSCKR